MKTFKEIIEESKAIDEEMESLMQSIGYESLINVLEEDNKFKTEYESKAKELKQLLNEMGC